MAAKRKVLRITKVLKSLSLWILFLLVSAVAGYLAVWLPCLITGTTFHLTFMPYVPFDRGLLVLAAILVFAAAIGYVKLQKKLKCNPADVLAGGLFLNLIFLLVFALVLHGGTYLFLWPLLLTSLYIACEVLLSGDKKWHDIVKQCMKALYLMFMVLMYFLLIYSLFLALTIGALAVMLLLLSIPLSIIAPSVLSQDIKAAS